MILMALDHARIYFSNADFSPTNLEQTNAAWFLTRWITHFCAPTFILLAGTSAFLYGERGHTKRQLAVFLFTRGLWLILLELTVIRFAWTFDLGFQRSMGTVIWAIGWSMIFLAPLIFLPPRAVLAIGVVMIAGHNLLDSIRAESLGSFAWLWKVLHERGRISLGDGYTFSVVYPLIPWIGVMAAGFGMGPLFRLEPATRKKWLVAVGISLTLAFIALRASNLYGDPRPWAHQERPWFTLFSFLNCSKYPPSLLYLLMTLGPVLLVLGLLENSRIHPPKQIIVFGRVPFFFYILHFFLLHGLAVLTRSVDTLISPDAESPGRFGLPGVYLIWLIAVLALYPLCTRFAALKQRSQSRWLSYF